MKILIPYPRRHPGGPGQFVRRLTPYLKQAGWLVANEPTLKFDRLLVISECPIWLALYAKLTGKKIVQRLDGVYHAGLPGSVKYLYPIKNLRMQIIHNFLADHIVYQSKFSQASCRALLGQPRGQTSLIYNGVTIPQTSARTSSGRPSPLKLITTGRFRRADQITPILKSLSYLTIPYHLTIIGPHTKSLASIFSPLTSNPSIAYDGAATHQQITATLPSQHIFLFCDQSACPNAVIEALAAGLPIVAFNRGSLSELIEPGLSGELTSLPRHNPYQDPYPFNRASYQQFATKIELVASHLNSYQNHAAARAKQQYDLTYMSKQYANLLR